MKLYIGCDLGTSALKLILTDSDGKILGSVSENYPVHYPFDGWSEQDPDDWIAALDRGMERLLSQGERAGINRLDVRAIAVGGQMHGLVAVDKRGAPVRECILWNDGRAESETNSLNARAQYIMSRTSNIAFAGFTAPKIMWLKSHEPENFLKTSHVLLPKDYINFYLTGEYSSDCSDAAGTLLFDVKNRNWSGDMCDLIGISPDLLPKVYESFEPVGALRDSLSKRWGLKNVIIAAGAGDNAAAAIGTGAIGDGAANISLGTSGTLFISSSSFSPSPNPAIHTFCHADGGYHLLGCILSAASCNSWWMGVLGARDFAAEQSQNIPLPAGNVYFLPYLSGERSPHNDLRARGAFIGLSHTTTRAEMTAAVFEGVSFALRDCLETAKSGGIKIASASICGGGAKSALWRRILSSALNLTLKIPRAEEGPAYGAAILSMVADGLYPNVFEACNRLIKFDGLILPDAGLAAEYDKKYEKFRRLYPALKSFYDGD